MIKSILLSNRSKYSYLIMKGEKKYEVRKSRLPQGVPIYNYVTKDKPLIIAHPNYGWQHKKQYSYFLYGSTSLYENEIYLNGTIPFRFKVGEIIEVYFTNNGYEALFVGDTGSDDIGEYDLLSMSWLTENELLDYGKGKTLYFHEIIDLEIFDKPMQLSDFYKRTDYYVEDHFDHERYVPLKKAPQSYQYVWTKK